MSKPSKKVEVNVKEPAVIADRICWPAPMWSVKEGMKFFIEKEQQLAMQRQDKL